MLKNVKIYAGDARSVIEAAPMKAPVETGDTLTREISGIITKETDIFYLISFCICYSIPHRILI